MKIFDSKKSLIVGDYLQIIYINCHCSAINIPLVVNKLGEGFQMQKSKVKSQRAKTQGRASVILMISTLYPVETFI